MLILAHACYARIVFINVILGAFMIEILWRARGGQGAFTAARVLGAAAALGEGGAQALAFPAFGPERRGAPMRAFTKISDAPIGDRSAITQADIVIYLDDTLFGEGWEVDLKPGGRVFVNSVREFDDARVVSIDANALSSAVLGRAIPNTTFLGALAYVLDCVTIEDIIRGIEECMPAKLHAKNIEVVKRAYDEAAALLDKGIMPDKAAGEGSIEGESTNATQVDEVAGAMSLGKEKDAIVACVGGSQAEDRRAGIRPHLCAPTLDPAVYARDTCGPAGMLTQKNAGWREVRPVIDHEKCTGCFQCYMACPDGTIYKTREALLGSGSPSAKIDVDLDFCKGCGVCARVCPVSCIAMVPEGAKE
jgi:pyruvate ferredoxin oxidoreductase gamma subunit